MAVSYTYWPNGNLKTDAKENLSLSYNFSNLLSAVRRGTAQIAAITYLSDGTKVKVLSEQTIIHHSDLKSVFTGF